MRYLTRDRAAAYITEQTGIVTTAQALADRAHDRTGPAYAIVAGRALYTAADIDAWISAQAARPVVRRISRASQLRTAADPLATIDAHERGEAATR